MLRLILSLFQKQSDNSSSKDWAPPEREQLAFRLKAAAEIIEEWILHTGLTNGRRSDIDFYLAAYHRDQFRGDAMRKIGTAMTLDRKRELGLNSRAIFTEEFWETLSEQGRADPIATAWMLSAPANTRIGNRDHLHQLHALDMNAVLMASPMAAGPCEWAKAVNEQAFDPAEAPLPPVIQCPHPEQCACTYRGRLDLD